MESLFPDPHSLMHLKFTMLQMFQNVRTKPNLPPLEQQNNGRACQFKMSLFLTAANADIFPRIADTAYHQCPDFSLYHRTEVLRSQQCPVASVQHIHGIVFTGNGLDAVEYAGNEVIFPLIAIVNVTIMMIVGCTQTKNQTIAAAEAICKVIVLQKITDAIVRVFDVKSAALLNRICAEPSVTRADEMRRGAVKRYAFSGTSKEIPKCPKIFQLCFGETNAVTLCIGSNDRVRPAGTQKGNHQSVSMAGHDAFQQKASGRSPIKKSDDAGGAAHNSTPIRRTASSPQPHSSIPILPGR